MMYAERFIFKLRCIEKKGVKMCIDSLCLGGIIAR